MRVLGRSGYFAGGTMPGGKDTNALWPTPIDLSVTT